MNVTEFRDLQLSAEVEARRLIAEVVEDWYAPDVALQVAATVNAMAVLNPDALDFVDAETHAKIREVIHAR